MVGMLGLVRFWWRNFISKNELVEINFDKAIGLSKEDLQKYIGELEELMKQGEEIEIPVEHYFSFGVYAREIIIPAGSLIVGKIHKYQNMNILSQGEASVLSIDGIKRVKAPHTFVSQPGAKRVIYAHTDVVWTTILGSDEKDHEAIEDKFIAKSYAELVHPDHEDYECFLKEHNLTKEYVRAIADNENDMDYSDDDMDKIKISASKIDRNGLFAVKTIQQEEEIGPARLSGKRTKIGKFANHSKSSNSRFIRTGKDIYLIAKQLISIDDEITVDYRESVKLMKEESWDS